MSADFTYSNHGSIILLTPLSEAATGWVEDHIPDDAQMWGRNSVVVEWRYFDAIANGIVNDGLTIEEK